MKNNIFDQFLDFLQKLDQQEISYSLAHHRDEAIMVSVALPGERWEVEFLNDGSVEIERFISQGEISGEEALNELFTRYSDPENVSIETNSNPNLVSVQIDKPKIELERDREGNYHHLEKLLKAGAWKEADQETAKKMLEVAGRTKERWLDEDSINNFPCEDLRTIDQLWVKYSNGRFGFSAQKKIWQEVGGKVDWETEDKLGDCVGWRKNGDWISYDDLTFSLQAPVGHLPRVGRVSMFINNQRWASLFLSRVNSCKLTPLPTAKPTPQSDIELKSARGVNYRQLEQLLKAGQWKKADQETAQKMLEVVRRAQEGYLRVEDINNFPCEDLRTIDQLWVKYSKGHFGFSVQKKIWLEVGGKVDDETECKLGDHMGWRKNGSWMSYDNLTFSLLLAPVGHLPAVAMRLFMGFSGFWEFCTVLVGFFCRVKNCKL